MEICIEKCGNCKYHDSDFSWVCVCSDSEHCADFTDNDDFCDFWEKANGERTSSDVNGNTPRE